MKFKMLRIILGVFIIYISYVSCFNDNLVAEGKWQCLNVQQCENAELYENKVIVFKTKYNRTTDMFTVKLVLVQEINNSHGMYLKVCKIVDGGCKPYQDVTDNSLENFIKKYAKENFYRFLEKTGTDIKDFPLPQGEMEATGFAMDYDELPNKGPIGEYLVDIFVMQGHTKIACVNVHVMFIEKEEWDELQSDEE